MTRLPATRMLVLIASVAQELFAAKLPIHSGGVEMTRLGSALRRGNVWKTGVAQNGADPNVPTKRLHTVLMDYIRTHAWDPRIDTASAALLPRADSTVVPKLAPQSTVKTYLPEIIAASVLGGLVVAFALAALFIYFRGQRYRRLHEPAPDGIEGDSFVQVPDAKALDKERADAAKAFPPAPGLPPNPYERQKNRFRRMRDAGDLVPPRKHLKTLSLVAARRTAESLGGESVSLLAGVVPPAMVSAPARSTSSLRMVASSSGSSEESSTVNGPVARSSSHADKSPPDAFEKVKVDAPKDEGAAPGSSSPSAASVHEPQPSLHADTDIDTEPSLSYLDNMPLPDSYADTLPSPFQDGMPLPNPYAFAEFAVPSSAHVVNAAEVFADGSVQPLRVKKRLSTAAQVLYHSNLHMYNDEPVVRTASLDDTSHGGRRSGLYSLPEVQFSALSFDMNRTT